MSIDDSEEEQTSSIATTSKSGFFAGDPNAVYPPCLVLVVGPPNYVGQQWNIDKAAQTLGRASICDVRLDIPSLSKMQAKLTVDGHIVSITDFGATNKTVVNATPCEPMVPVALNNNDQIRAGGLIFKFLQNGILSETSEKARMQTELETARSIQTSLFPVRQEEVYQSVKIGGRYRTASECGGDWWWHWSCGGRAFAIIADATGHGVGAAMLTSAARSAVATMEDDTSVDIAKVYSTLSRTLYKCANGEIEMSAFIVEVKLDTSKLRYINASHPAAVWLPADASHSKWNNLRFLRGPISANLGSSDEEVHIGESSIAKGERLVLLTDGLTERAIGRSLWINEREFYTSLIEAHAANSNDQAAFLDGVLERSDAFAKNTPQDDDITVVAIDF